MSDQAPSFGGGGQPLLPSGNAAGDNVSAADVKQALEKAAASLPGYAPREMSHAGLAPGGQVRLTNYVSA